MKIKDAIAYVDSVKPNAFDDAAKILWLNEVEGLVQTEAMLIAVADLIEYTADTDPETELLVRSPHDKIYRAYLMAMVDFANGEYNRYANTVEMFNTYFAEFVVWYADKYRPADGGAVDDGYYITAYGIAVKHGFDGDEAAWLETLKGEPGRGFEIRGKYDTVEQLQAAVTGPEIGDAYAVGNEEPYHVFIWGVDGWFDFGTMKGEPGRDGRDGKDGYTPQKGVDYTDGKDGADGYTPQKGVDYFTDADKAEIAREAAKLVEIPDVRDDDAVKYTPEERSEDEQAQARENIGAASVGEVVELGKSIPKVYAWANAELPFTEAQISNTAGGAGFVVNPTNFADGKTYFRYHAGPTSFAWTNPNPQKGAVTITVLGWSQYADKATANGFSTLNIAYADGTTGRLQLVNGQAVTMTTDAGKVLTQIKGNYDHENWVLLDMDVLSIVADYPAPTGTVKSVNGNLPDEDGNVEIDIPEGGGGGGGISQDELQAAVNAAIEQAKAGLLVFEDSYVNNTANWLTNGYTKVSQTATIGQPSQCTGADKWGVLFFIAENAANGTGTQMYFPIDGTYKGRIFTRSITRRAPGTWYLLPTMNDITADHTLGLSGAAVGQIACITAVDGDGVPTAWDSVKLPSGGSGGGGATDHTLGLSGAAVGQIARVTVVDDDGVPIAWESVDLPTEEVWELLADVTIEEEVNGYSVDFDNPQKKLRVIVDSLAADADTNYSGFTVHFNNEAGTTYYPKQLIYPLAIPRKSAGVSVYDISTYYIGEIPCADITTMFQVDAQSGTGNTPPKMFHSENLTEPYYGKLMVPEISRFSQNTYGKFAVGTRYRIYGVRA